MGENKSCARHEFRDKEMNKNSNDGISTEEPMGNIEIPLGKIKSFIGNRDINSVETLVDDAFKGFHTVSIEGYDKKYFKEERQTLLDEIYKLQNGGE